MGPSINDVSGFCTTYPLASPSSRSLPSFGHKLAIPSSSPLNAEVICECPLGRPGAQAVVSTLPLPFQPSSAWPDAYLALRENEAERTREALLLRHLSLHVLPSPSLPFLHHLCLTQNLLLREPSARMPGCNFCTSPLTYTPDLPSCRLPDSSVHRMKPLTRHCKICLGDWYEWALGPQG